MHLLLTDRLTCPRCGPEFGLILLSTRTVDRRVFEGAVGCANCREQYPVRDGYADLRLPPRAPLSDASVSVEERSDLDAMALAALLGVREGPATLLLIGDSGEGAPDLTAILDGVDVVVTTPGARAWSEVDGIDRIAVTEGRLPLRTGAIRAAAIHECDLNAWEDEVLRVLQPSGRIVVLEPRPSTADALEERGLHVVLRDKRAAVVERPPRRSGVASPSAQK
jgi:uncharacterized protein YbaR (Trm112 family)